MALKKNETFDIDDSQFLDEDFDLDFENFDSDGKESKAKTVAKAVFSSLQALGKGALNGALSSLGDNVRGFSEVRETMASTVEMAKGLSNDAVEDTKKMLKAAHRFAGTGLPMLREVVPDKIYKTLDEKIVQTMEKPEEEDTSEEARNEQYTNSIIEATLVDVFKKTQKGENLRFAAEAKERLIDRTIGSRQHKESIQAVGIVAKHASQISSFLRTTYMSYLRKDIELKYRSYFVSKENLAVAKGLAQLAESSLKSINEGVRMSEAQKVRAEREKNAPKGPITSKNFMSGYMDKLKESVKAGTFGFMSDMTDLLDTSTEALGMFGDMPGMGGNIKQTAANMGLGAGGWALGKFLMNKFTDKHLPFFNLLGEDLQELVQSAGAKLNAMTKKTYNSGIMNFLTGFLPSFKRDTAVTNTAATNPTDPATFDNLTRESIISVIPAHLERIGDVMEGMTRHFGISIREESRKTYSLQERKLITTASQRRKVERMLAGNEAERHQRSEQNKGDMVANILAKYKVDSVEEARRNQHAAKELDDLEAAFPLINRALSAAGYNNVDLDPDLLRKFAENGDNPEISRYITSLLGGTGETEQNAAKLLLTNITRNGKIDQTAIRNINRTIRRQADYHDKMSEAYKVIDETGMGRFDSNIRYNLNGEPVLNRASMIGMVGDVGKRGDLEAYNPETGEKVVKSADSVDREIALRSRMTARSMKGFQKTADAYRERFVKEAKDSGIAAELGLTPEEMLEYAESSGFSTAARLSPKVVATFLRARTFSLDDDLQRKNIGHVVRHEKMEDAPDFLAQMDNRLNTMTEDATKRLGLVRKKRLSYISQESANTFTVHYTDEKSGKTYSDRITTKKSYRLPKGASEPDMTYVQSVVDEVRKKTKYKDLVVPEGRKPNELFYFQSDNIQEGNFDQVFNDQKQYAASRESDYGPTTTTGGGGPSFHIERTVTPGVETTSTTDLSPQLLEAIQNVGADVTTIVALLKNEEHETVSPIPDESNRPTPALPGPPKRRRVERRVVRRDRPSILPPQRDTLESVANIVFTGEPESGFHADFRLFADKVLAALHSGGGSALAGAKGVFGKAWGWTKDRFQDARDLAGRGLTGAKHLLFGDKEEGTKGLIGGTASLIGKGAMGAASLAGRGLKGGWHLLAGNDETGSRGLVRGTKDLLFGNADLDKKGLIPAGFGLGKRALFGDRETGARGLVGGTSDLIFGNRDLDKKGLLGHALGAAGAGKRFLFGDAEAGRRGLIPGAKDYLFGDRKTGQEGVISSAFRRGKTAIFGDEATGELGYLQRMKDAFRMPDSLTDWKAKILGGQDASGKAHLGLFKSVRNKISSLFGEVKERFVDIYRKDRLELGKPLLKVSDQETGVFFADGSKVDSSKSIDRPVVDSNNNTLISQDDINAGLVDKDGDSIYDPKETLLKKVWKAGTTLVGKAGSTVFGKLADIFGVGDKGAEGKGGSFWGSIRKSLGVGKTSHYQSRVVQILEAIAAKMGADVPADKTDEDAEPGEKGPGVVARVRNSISERLRTLATAMTPTEQPPAEGEGVRATVRRKLGTLGSTIGAMATRMAVPMATPIEGPTDDDLLAQGYLRDNDGNWYDQSGRGTTREAILAELRPKKTEATRPSILDTAKGRVTSVFDQMKAKRQESRLDKGGYFNMGPDQWYDPNSGETYTAREAEQRLKEMPKDMPLTSFQEQLLNLVKGIFTSSEKTAEETEKMAQGPDTEGTEGEQGSAAQQRAKREKEEAERKEKLARRKEEDAANRRKKEEARSGKSSGGKDGDKDDEDGGGGFLKNKLMGKTFDKVLNKFLGKNAAKVLHGRGAKALTQRALIKFGGKNAARTLMTKGWAGLGKAALTSPAAIATALGALGGTIGLTGSRSSGAGKVSNLFSTGAGATAGVAAALSNPLTAGIAAAALAGNAMREGWNDKKTLKTSWGGENALDSQKGASAVGNIANYLSFGLLNKYGGRKYVDKALNYTTLGHMVGGVGSQIAGTADVFKGAYRAFKGEDAAMNDDELRRARASLNANIKRGTPQAQEHLEEFELAVRKKDWKTARRLSNIHVKAGREMLKGVKRYAKGTLAIATGGVSSMIESAFSNAKPMTEDELKKAREYIAALKKAKRPGAKEIEIKFEQAVEAEDWPVARKLGKQLRLQTRGGQIARKVLKGAMLLNAYTAPVALFMSNQNEPLTEKEIADFRKRCEESIKAGNKPAEALLEKFNDAVALQEWRKARKLSNMKDKSIAETLAPAARKLVSAIVPFAAFFDADQNEPLKEQEILQFRTQMQNMAKRGDQKAKLVLQKFDEACLLQKWDVARRLADIPAKSTAAKKLKRDMNFWFGDQEKPLTEEEIQKFRESCKRKIEMGDDVARQKLNAFNEAVSNMSWKTAREISEMKDTGAAHGVGKFLKKGLQAQFRTLFVLGRDEEPMKDTEIEKFRERMNKLIESGSPEAKMQLSKFEDAVLDGNWKKARAIAGITVRGDLGAAAKGFINLFNDKIKEKPVDDKMTAEGDLAERYRLIYSKVQDALKKNSIGMIDRYSLSRLRDEMQTTDVTDLDETKLNDWETRLRDHDKSVGDLSKGAVSAYEKDRKAKSKLVTQQTNLLNEIIEAQKRTGIFEVGKRTKLKRLFKEVESMDFDELDEEMLNLYDTELRSIDSRAVSTRDFSPEQKRKMLDMMKRQTKLVSVIDQSKKTLGWKHPVKQSQLNKLKGQVESAPVEELTDDDFDLWDDELQAIDPRAESSIEHSVEEQRKLLELKKKKAVLVGLVEKARKKSKWMSSARSTLGKLLKEMDGTADEDMTDEDISLWEDTYKSVDPKAVGLNEQMALDEATARLLKKRDELKKEIGKDIRRAKLKSTKPAKEFIKQANKLLDTIDGQRSEEYTDEFHLMMKKNYQSIQEKYPIGADKKLKVDHKAIALKPEQEEPKKEEPKKGSGGRGKDKKAAGAASKPAIKGSGAPVAKNLKDVKGADVVAEPADTDAPHTFADGVERKYYIRAAGWLWNRMFDEESEGTADYGNLVFDLGKDLEAVQKGAKSAKYWDHVISEVNEFRDEQDGNFPFVWHGEAPSGKKEDAKPKKPAAARPAPAAPAAGGESKPTLEGLNRKRGNKKTAGTGTAAATTVAPEASSDSKPVLEGLNRSRKQIDLPKPAASERKLNPVLEGLNRKRGSKGMLQHKTMTPPALEALDVPEETGSSDESRHTFADDNERQYYIKAAGWLYEKLRYEEEEDVADHGDLLEELRIDYNRVKGNKTDSTPYWKLVRAEVEKYKKENRGVLPFVWNGEEPKGTARAATPVLEGLNRRRHQPGTLKKVQDDTAKKTQETADNTSKGSPYEYLHEVGTMAGTRYRYGNAGEKSKALDFSGRTIKLRPGASGGNVIYSASPTRSDIQQGLENTRSGKDTSEKLQKAQEEKDTKAQATADNTSKGVQALGQLTSQEVGILQQILGEIHNVIGAVAESKAKTNATIEQTAVQSIGIMKNYADGSFQPMAPVATKPLTREPAINIRKTL